MFTMEKNQTTTQAATIYAPEDYLCNAVMLLPRGLLHGENTMILNQQETFEHRFGSPKAPFFPAGPCCWRRPPALPA